MHCHKCFHGVVRKFSHRVNLIEPLESPRSSLDDAIQSMLQMHVTLHVCVHPSARRNVASITELSRAPRNDRSTEQVWQHAAMH